MTDRPPQMGTCRESPESPHTRTSYCVNWQPVAPEKEAGSLCADCHCPKNDSSMHFEAPGDNWGSALHHFVPENDIPAVAPMTQPEHILRNLLAVIHRDGGHYVEEHGLEKAGKDAEKIVVTMSPIQRNHAARAKLEMKFWAAMHQVGLRDEWDAQEKIKIKDLAKLLAGVAETPTDQPERCQCDERGCYCGIPKSGDAVPRTPPPVMPIPDGYAYQYPDGIRCGTSGRAINGNPPLMVIPYYYHGKVESYASSLTAHKDAEIANWQTGMNNLEEEVAKLLERQYDLQAELARRDKEIAELKERIKHLEVMWRAGNAM